MEWYAVRTVYEHTDLRSGHDRLYEERIILVRAADGNDAIAKAEEEAASYERDLDGVEFLEFAQTYGPLDGEPGEGVEIFSLMRRSRMAPDPYVTRFFDSGRECIRNFADDPS